MPYSSTLESEAEYELMTWDGIQTDIHADQILQTIKDDAVVYKEWGFDVSLQIAQGDNSASLQVSHPKKRPTSPPRVAMLKAAACGTIQRTRWGGSR